MNRIAIKFAALLLLSTGYVMASTTASRPNILKDATKTNIVCSCTFDGQTVFAICPPPGIESCTQCCAGAGGK
jgi:hypothetical protein